MVTCSVFNLLQSVKRNDNYDSDLLMTFARL